MTTISEYKRKKKTGLCVGCGKKKPLKDKVRCRNCLNYNSNHRTKGRANIQKLRKRIMKEKSLVTINLKIWKLFKNYLELVYGIDSELIKEFEEKMFK